MKIQEKSKYTIMVRLSQLGKVPVNLTLEDATLPGADRLLKDVVKDHLLSDGKSIPVIVMLRECHKRKTGKSISFRTWGISAKNIEKEMRKALS